VIAARAAGRGAGSSITCRLGVIAAATGSQTDDLDTTFAGRDQRADRTQLRCSRAAARHPGPAALRFSQKGPERCSL